jgi:6-phosphogluconolactonase
MVLPLNTNIRVLRDADSVAQQAAASVVARIRSAAGRSGIFSLVLSGGSTPKALYRLLASEFRDQVPWDRVHLFWGDERYVSPDDPLSNYRMVKESLLSHIGIPPQNVHPMPSQFTDPHDAARAYEELLRTYYPLPFPCFDLVLLGLGPEGHTASLFPDSPALEEHDRWVIAVKAPANPPIRLTLSLPVLNSAAEVFFLAVGVDKAAAVEQAVTASPDKAPRVPAGMVRPERGNVIWWMDEAAASHLPPSFRLG